MVGKRTTITVSWETLSKLNALKPPKRSADEFISDLIGILEKVETLAKKLKRPPSNTIEQILDLVVPFLTVENGVLKLKSSIKEGIVASPLLQKIEQLEKRVAELERQRLELIADLIERMSHSPEGEHK